MANSTSIGTKAPQLTLKGSFQDIIGAAIVLESPTDPKILLTRYNEGWWFPHERFSLAKDMNEARMQLLTGGCGVVDFEIPHCHTSVYELGSRRVNLYVDFVITRQDAKDLLTDKNQRLFTKADLDNLLEGSHREGTLAGPEPVEYFKQMTTNMKELVKLPVFTDTYSTVEFESRFAADQDTGMLFKEADIRDSGLLRQLYSLYSAQSYPISTMNRETFYNILTPVFMGDKVKLWTAFNKSKSVFLSFPDFLRGLLLTDDYFRTHTFVQRQLFLTKLRFIYAFYESYGAEKMSDCNWQILCGDMFPEEGDIVDRAKAEKLRLNVCGQGVPLAALEAAYEKGILGDIFSLVYMTHSFIEEMFERGCIATPNAEMLWPPVRYNNAGQTLEPPRGSKTYDVLKVSPRGTQLSVQAAVWADLAPLKLDCLSPQSTYEKTKPTVCASKDSAWRPHLSADKAVMAQASKAKSPTADATMVLHFLADNLLERRLEKHDLTFFKHFMLWRDATSPRWGNVESYKQFVESFIKLCSVTKGIVKGENRLLKLSDPTMVFGDIHGNMRDLLIYERCFWPHGPTLSPANILFLGDYVDRGVNGIEVCAYLFAQKAIAPDRVFLVRGNHDERDVNSASQGESYVSFLAECQQKLGVTDGRRVWEAANSVFDCMPLAATIGETAFAVHGGIPSSATSYAGTLEVLEKVPNPLLKPQQNPLARELLWNDPLVGDVPTEVVAKMKDGFCGNKPRTGSWNSGVKMFNEDALSSFLMETRVGVLIRAQQATTMALRLREGFNMVCVSSSSLVRDCGNDAAVVMVSQTKTRVVVVNTSDGQLSAEEPIFSRHFPRASSGDECGRGDNFA